jgi:hypothetical protein
MQDTVDPAAVPPRTPAQISGDAPRGAERGVAVAVAAKVSAGDPVTRLHEGRGEAIARPCPSPRPSLDCARTVSSGSPAITS